MRKPVEIGTQTMDSLGENKDNGSEERGTKTKATSKTVEKDCRDCAHAIHFLTHLF